MNRMLRSALVALAFLPIACNAQLANEPYELGKHYKLVRDVQAPANPQRIEVAEIFWYGCPHCYQFEPFVQRWAAKKPADVDFVRVPASLGRPAGIVHSKAFYAAEALGVTERVHKALFEAMHERGRMVQDEAAMRAFFAQHAGVSAEDFNAAFNGFAVDSKVRKAELSLRDYGISGVPAVVVGGKYLTSGGMAGSYDEVFKVVEFLVAKLRKERGIK